MSLLGPLLKFTTHSPGFEFPLKYIKIDTYDCAPNQRQDLDSYTDAYGITRRNALAHTKTDIQFTTREMTGNEMHALMNGITGQYKNVNERDFDVEYWDMETQSEKTGHFYLDPSLKFRVLRLSRDASKIEKNGEMQWRFIEY